MNDAHPPHHQSPGSHFQPSLPTVIVILILFVSGAYFMLRSSAATSGGSATTTTIAGVTTTTTATNTQVPKSRVRVQVANGTSVTGLAASYTQLLMTQGWDVLPQTNGPKESATVVYYNPGFEWAAAAIASAVNVPSSAVKPLNGLNPVSGSSGDDVIAILGPDVAIKG